MVSRPSEEASSAEPEEKEAEIPFLGFGINQFRELMLKNGFGSADRTEPSRDSK